MVDVFLAKKVDISKSITRGDYYFKLILDLKIDCSVNNTYYYAIDYSCSSGKITIFKSNWALVKFIYILNPRSMVGINDSFDVNLIITTRYGIYRFDRELIFLQFYSYYQENYGKMYYNRSSDRLYICSTGNNRIDVFDHSLEFIKSISISPNQPIDIDVYNDYMYVTTNNNTILVFQNDLNVKNITFFNISIASSLIDQNGNIAILSNSNIIYVYSANGTYLGANWISNVPSLVGLSLDLNGNLVLLAFNGIFIVNNNNTPQVANSGILLDDACIIKSMSLNVFILLIYSII